ncbi:MAG: hypothetical protein QXH02_06355 [Desulfurococcaceae archaeon]
MHRLFAVIVLLGVAIAISAAAVTWIITTYRSMTWKPEVLRILDIEMYLNETDGSWWLRVVAVNEGEGVAEIYRVEVHGMETIELDSPETIGPGNQREVYFKLSREYTHGTMYTVRLYLKSGTVYPVLERVIRP